MSRGRHESMRSLRTAAHAETSWVQPEMQDDTTPRDAKTNYPGKGSVTIKSSPKMDAVADGNEMQSTRLRTAASCGAPCRLCGQEPGPWMTSPPSVGEP